MKTKRMLQRMVCWAIVLCLLVMCCPSALLALADSSPTVYLRENEEYHAMTGFEAGDAVTINIGSAATDVTNNGGGSHKFTVGDNTFVYDTDEVYCVWQNSTDENLLTRVSLDIFEKDEDDEETYYRYCEEFSERGYELEVLRQYLEENKFEVIGIYEELTKNEVREDTQRAVFVAKKHGTQ